MFGWVPKLPVDVMSKQMLRDPVVVDYGSHAKMLLSHLHEAATIAQRHAVKEQQKQAQGYNKRVKGTHLNVGDRVLIANKGERGKRKLADKWEATVYVVVDLNPQTHTYVVQDEKGIKRVVHRNLLLNIRFLPVQTELEGGQNPSLDDCVGTDESQVHSQLQDFASSLGSESSERRTSLWVLNGTEDFQGQGPQSDIEAMQSHLEAESLNQEDSCSAKSGDDDCSITDHDRCQTDDSCNEGNKVIPAMETRDMSNTELPSQESRNQDIQGEENAQERVTRTGRVVKKVSRLIETMAQRGLNIKPITNSLGRKSQSLLTF